MEGVQLRRTFAFWTVRIVTLVHTSDRCGSATTGAVVGRRGRSGRARSGAPGGSFSPSRPSRAASVIGRAGDGPRVCLMPVEVVPLQSAQLAAPGTGKPSQEQHGGECRFDLFGLDHVGTRRTVAALSPLAVSLASRRSRSPAVRSESRTSPSSRVLTFSTMLRYGRNAVDDRPIESQRANQRSMGPATVSVPVVVLPFATFAAIFARSRSASAVSSPGRAYPSVASSRTYVVPDFGSPAAVTRWAARVSIPAPWD